MAQKTFVSEILTASDVNTYLAGEGGAWSSWTPVVTQTSAVTVTNSRSRFARYGRTIHFSMFVTVTGTGTAGGAIQVTLPVTAAAGDALDITGILIDDSTGSVSPFISYVTSTTAFRLKAASSSVATGLLGNAVFTAALASGDTVRCAGTYEAAS